MRGVVIPAQAGIRRSRSPMLLGDNAVALIPAGVYPAPEPSAMARYGAACGTGTTEGGTLILKEQKIT